ncbi:MAG: LuxR C-terminal-related transcriptional regulator [Oscillospiraceae bacterium]|nr:LuxR C-terminal-related transcriptional regulator [Oscillospiraceae bacterium]
MLAATPATFTTPLCACAGGGVCLERPRISHILEAAMRLPITMLCAGAGYGKTCAVYSFLATYPARIIWRQMAECDNTPALFWEHYALAAAKSNPHFARWLMEIGFPASEAQINNYCAELPARLSPDTKFVLVLDDFHLIHNPAILRLYERAIARLPGNCAILLLTRTEPPLNLGCLAVHRQTAVINEDDLRFTRPELTEYFGQLAIPVNAQGISNILHDTQGWAQAVNLLGSSLKELPACETAALRAMKQNIFQMLECDVFSTISARLQCFLLRLSLIDRLDADLVYALAGDDALIDEMQQINAYIRYDMHLNAYRMHPLFLDFLKEKQALLAKDERRGTYQKAGDWCARSGLQTDAIAYYEKIGAYAAIVALLLEQPTPIPAEMARRTFAILNRAPAAVFRNVELSAFAHIRSALCAGLFAEASALVARYEAQYLAMPDSAFKFRMLGCIYYCAGILRSLLCIRDGRYDFDVYFAKQDACLSQYPVTVGGLADHPVGPWFSQVGDARKEATAEYTAALTQSVWHVSHCFHGAMSGEDDAARGELLFYQNDLAKAEIQFAAGLQKAEAYRQFEIANRIRIYCMRMAFLQGNLEKASRVMKTIEAQLEEETYAFRYTTYDVALGWYHYTLREPAKIPLWLHGPFAPYGHACFLENFANQLKARYFFLTKNYPDLLAYIKEMRGRESILLGRTELLAMEACVHYDLKNTAAAFATLAEAYAAAQSNRLVIPFASLGKDMRTLTSAAIRGGCDIPLPWLEQINRQAATFAKRQAQMCAQHGQTNGGKTGFTLSAREKEALFDLSHGLSRSEIAASRGISVNTVKILVEALHSKLGAVNTADLIRLAMENALL